MSIEIAENSEIDYGKNIGLAWPGQWFLGPATLVTCKPACKPCTKKKRSKHQTDINSRIFSIAIILTLKPK